MLYEVITPVIKGKGVGLRNVTKVPLVLMVETDVVGHDDKIQLPSGVGLV